MDGKVTDAEVLATLLSGAVHDLNNLLAPILLYADLIQETTETDGIRKKASAILAQAEKIRSSLEAVRILYKDPAEEMATPAALAPHFHCLLRPLYQKAGVRLSWFIESNLPSIGTQGVQRRIAFFRAAAEFAVAAPPRLYFIWRGLSGGGSETLLVEPHGEPGGGRLSAGDGPEIRLFTRGHEPPFPEESTSRPLFVFSWA